LSELLFSPYRLGRIELKNRVVMAPMTRNRSVGNVPTEIEATYFAQRSEAGLIITGGVSPSPNGLGYARISGLFAPEQVAAFRRVTDAVHRAGSHIFVQLMHTGRVGHPANLPPGARVLGPSALAAPDAVFTDAAGPQPPPEPEAMTERDVEAALGEHERAAELAVEAGFDGVELHGANGYLIDQFLNAASNRRADRWGGGPEGRARFAVEAVARVSAKVGPDRVGIRLSPYGVFNGMQPDERHDELYEHLASRLNDLGVAYVHLVDQSSLGAPPAKGDVGRSVRGRFRGALVLSGGYDRARAEHDLAAGSGDLIAFGRPFIANPRLISKLKRGAPLAAPDAATFYTPGEAGYTDYPLDDGAPPTPGAPAA
jgi:N-ethylmaleimide reductase